MENVQNVKKNKSRQWLAKLYNKVLEWSRHRHAPRYLAIVSFIDSSFFPVSPMFMFIPMSFAHPSRTFWYATIGTLGSILGGMLGYCLGVFAFDALVAPFLQWMGYETFYHSALQAFEQWGFWAVLVGCFSPIPYKIFTIGAGVMQLNFPLFLIASSLGRFLRFFVVGCIIWWGGPKVETVLRRLLL